MSVFGDPNSFALIIDTVGAWNVAGERKSGIFHFVVDQRIFPRRAVVSVLSADLGDLMSMDALLTFPENDSIRGMEADEAFRLLLNGMLPYILMNDNVPDDFETSYTYQASTGTLEDNGCFAFAVGVGAQVRILAAEIVRDPEGGGNQLIDVSEAWIEKDYLVSLINDVKLAFPVVDKVQVS